MKRLSLGLVGILVLGLCSARAEVGVEDLKKEFCGETPAQKRSPAEAQAAYAQVLNSLLPDMGSEDVKLQEVPQRTIQRMAFYAGRPGADIERAALSNAMAAKVGEGTAPIARVWLLRQLEGIGRAECVPAVAEALKSKEQIVRETARRTLQNNPSPEAGKALLGALESADTPQWRAAVVDSLGYRKEVGAAQAIAKLAQDSDDGVRAAACAALALIGDKAAIDQIAGAMTKGSPEAQRVATDSYLRLAEALCGSNKPEALSMYRKLTSSAQNQVKCAAIIGLGRAGGAAELGAIFDAMSDADVKVRGAGLSALNLIPTSPEVLNAICEKVKSATAPMKVMLLRALISRNEKSTLPVFVAAAEDPSEEVKIEATKGLAAFGDASAVPVLVKLAVAGGALQDAARLSLDLLNGNDINAAMLGALGNADAASAKELIRSLAARKATESGDAMVKCLGHADAGVRAEAWKGLALVAEMKTLAPMVAALVKIDQDGERNDAVQNMVAACKRQTDVGARSEPVLAALNGAQGNARLALMQVAGRIGGVHSLEALRGALKDNDAKVQDAAVRALSDWPDATVADDLLAIAKNEAAPANRQVLALRGYIKVIGLPSGRPVPETLKLYQTAMATAKRLDEKRQALGGLGEIKDIKAFQMVEPMLADETLREEAALALGRIASELGGNQSKIVRPVLEKIIEICKNAEAKRKARELMDKKFKK